MLTVLSRTFTLGRYTCVEKVGQGPVGELWRAKRFGLAGLDRQYLVYRISAAQLAQDSTTALRLQAALRSVSEIQHQNLLRLEEFGTQAGDSFVAYDFVGFADLGKLKSGLDLLGDEAKVLLPQMIALLGQQLARALVSAQERGVSHGLLSPSCVFVDACGESHLSELGLWAVLPQGGWKPEGVLKPLAPYLAPELLQSGVPGPRTDVYALGSLLQEPLKWVPADKLTAESRSALLALQSICQRATSKTPAQRPQHMLELVKALDAVRVMESVPAQLQRFGRLFELSGDTVPQQVTTSDRSAAEPLPPPPSMKISLGKPADAVPAKTAGPGATDAAAKAPVPVKATPESDKKPSADPKAKNPVTINPRAAFGPGMTGGAASAVTPTADIDAAEAEIATSQKESSTKLSDVPRRRPTPMTVDVDHISVTETSPAMPAMGRQPQRYTPYPPKAVGGETPNEGQANAAQAALSAAQPQTASATQPAGTESGIAEVLEENPALDSTGSYSQPELAPAIGTDSLGGGTTQSAPLGLPKPSPSLVQNPKKLSTAAFVGIGLGAAVIAGVVMMAVIGRGTSGSNTTDAGPSDASAVAAQPSPQKQKPDELQVDSTPTAAVYLDGQAKGKTPAKLTVKPGSHKLLLVAEGYKLFKQEATGGQAVTASLVRAKLPDGVSGSAIVKVKCKHEGELRILVDGHDTGLTCPTEDLSLAPGKYTLGFLSPASDDLREKTLKVKKKGTKLKTKF
ncbi:MAG TPA: PEGA domain-containing protein [Pseudomonadota bacterium]|jgi:serine/threonine protein kinase|nr:PEGA domain-containing protein [Pseudomonadota bacterium]